MEEIIFSILALGIGTIITISVLIIAFKIITMWFLFEKGGEAGWISFIPIYNTITIIRIAGKPWWWIFFLLIPIVQIIFLVLIYDGLSNSFGKTSGFTVGLFFLTIIFMAIIAFDKSKFEGTKVF
ncbi:MAG: signal peptidase I [Bacteroidales bacterium]|nr:signal peptidase I [Bacteroidales bacterium]